MLDFKKLSLTLLLSCVVSFAWANESILKEKTSLLQDGAMIGYIPVLTPVDVLKTSNGKATIKIKGFRLENYPQMVVRDMKRGELYVEFEDEDDANKAFKIIKKFEDDYGEVWHEVEGEFKIDSKQIAKEPAKLYLNAKKTYERTCLMCHHLPASTAYTVNQWPQQIESMMEQVALDASTKSLIIKYLQQNASDAK